MMVMAATARGSPGCWASSINGVVLVFELQSTTGTSCKKVYVTRAQQKIPTRMYFSFVCLARHLERLIR